MSVEQLISLVDKHSELRTAWYRQILTVAAGGFALLVGLGTKVPPGIGKYFLAGTWVCLGLGIAAGGAATYLEVSRAKNLARDFREQLHRSLQSRQALSPTVPIVAKPGRLYAWSGPVMVVSLLTAVVCLVICSVLTALA
jgi:hypothetical protein